MVTMPAGATAGERDQSQEQSDTSKS
jgi:hypothetical protein